MDLATYKGKVLLIVNVASKWYPPHINYLLFFLKSSSTWECFLVFVRFVLRQWHDQLKLCGVESTIREIQRQRLTLYALGLRYYTYLTSKGRNLVLEFDIVMFYSVKHGISFYYFPKAWFWLIQMSEFNGFIRAGDSGISM